MNLDNKHRNSLSDEEICLNITSTCERLDQIHPLQRKLKFFLDARGYIKVNDLKGDYVEFGSYRSHTQFAAHHVLNPISKISQYIGLDSFDCPLEFTHEDKTHNTYEDEKDFSCSSKEVKKFVDRYIGERGHVIKGDFRERGVQEIFNKTCGDVSISMLDCNLISSTKAALQLVLPKCNLGSIVFLDDMFTNFSNGSARIWDLFLSETKKLNFKTLNFGNYPPFSKAVILYK
jgi:hypothetical protein